MPALSIVSDNPTPEPKPLSVAEVKGTLERCEREIDLFARRRNQLQANRHTALVSDLTEARELHVEVKELDERLSVLQEQHRSLTVELKAAQQREADEFLRTRERECEQVEAKLDKLLTKLQDMVDEVASIYLGNVKALVEKHQQLATELEPWQGMGTLYQTLMPLLLRRIEAHIQGPRACRGTLENGHELLQSGRLEVSKLLEAYIRHRKNAFTPQPPGAA